MRLIIAGGREFNNYELLEREVLDFIKDEKDITIISGLARGADTLGCKFADSYNLPMVGFAADWKKFGRGAGLKRNKLMAKNADALIAFWDGSSRGTMSMIDYAHELNLKIKVVQYIHISKEWN